MSSFPRRPPRLGRINPSLHPFFFVTFNTYRRRPVLAQESVHRAFAGYAGEAGRRGIAVGRYVMMPDHVHLFVCLPPEGPTLSRWIQGLKTCLGKELVRQGLTRPYWQEGFFDHLMRSSDSYSEKWEYMLQNPVRRGLVGEAAAWPYQGEIVKIRW